MGFSSSSSSTVQYSSEEWWKLTGGVVSSPLCVQTTWPPSQPPASNFCIGSCLRGFFGTLEQPDHPHNLQLPIRVSYLVPEKKYCYLYRLTFWPPSQPHNLKQPDHPHNLPLSIRVWYLVPEKVLVLVSFNILTTLTTSCFQSFYSRVCIGSCSLELWVPRKFHSWTPMKQHPYS